VKKTLEQELREVRALAEPRGQLVIDRLVRLADASDEFHWAAILCIEMLLEYPSDEELREIARKLLKRRELIGHSLSRPFQAPLRRV
jgi:hypothetical protein